MSYHALLLCLLAFLIFLFFQAKHVGSHHNLDGHFHKPVSYADIQLNAREELTQKKLTKFSKELKTTFASRWFFLFFVMFFHSFFVHTHL